MQLLPLRSVDRPISSVALCIDRAVETSNFLKQLHGIVCHCKDCESRRAVGEETTNALLHDDEHGGAFETRHPLLYQTHPDDRQIQAKIPKARKKKDRKIENEQWEEILTALFSAEVRRFRRTFQLPQKRSDTTSRIEKPCRWHKGKPVIIMNHGSMDASDKIMYPTSPLDNYPQQQDQPWPCAAARAGRSATNAEIENGGSLTRLSSVVHSGRFVFGAHSAQLRQCLLEQPGYEMALDDIYRWFRENTDRDHGTLDALEEARQFNPYMVSRHGTIEEVAEKHGKAAGEEYKKLLEKAAGLRKGWQCGVRHNLSQNKVSVFTFVGDYTQSQETNAKSGGF